MKMDKKMPAPIQSKQAGRNLTQLIQRFLKSEDFFFESETAVKLESLSDLYGCKNARN